MLKAIILPYVTCQNEPSEPINQVFEIPHDELATYTLLSALYKEIFDPDNEHSDPVGLQFKADTGSGFGDITATVPGSGCYLYVTYLDY